MKGQEVKEAIRKAGLTNDEAAVVLKMSRQTLYNNLNREILPPKFLRKVNTEFGEYFEKLNIQSLNTETTLEPPPVFEYGDDVRVLNKVLCTYEKTIHFLEDQVKMKDEIIKKLELKMENFKNKV